jgi:hypothetical protein
VQDAKRDVCEVVGSLESAEECREAQRIGSKIAEILSSGALDAAGRDGV